MRRPARGEQLLLWVGSSKRDLLAFPEAVKDLIGAALSVAQFGGKQPAAKPWKGEGPGVLEVVEDRHGNAYRAVCTVRFPEVAQRSTDAGAACGACCTTSKTGQTEL